MTTPTRPLLIASSHGTDDPDGQASIRAVIAAVAERLQDVDVVEAFVDVQRPALPDVVAAMAVGREAVIVPLLLSTGFHVEVDVREAADSRTGVVAARPLGPDDRITDLLVERWRESGADPREPVVLAVAGSSKPSAVEAIEAVRARFAERTGTRPIVGYGSAVAPNVAEAVGRARATGGEDSRVSVASYLLAPGFFQRRVLQAGGDLVSAPLGVHEGLVDVVVDRYLEAEAALASH
ncbi:sirohydrochlorin chelatase [Plantibacter flavus]|uniref:sirohydrochlorin chelatase n=1 Tax=Plantibacter flavus TaxID=150123 RepID=UPI003F17A83A